MKRKILWVTAVVIVSLFTKCKKNDTNTVVKDYSPLSSGSTFTYRNISEGDTTVYTLTVTGVDSSVNSKSYRKLTASDGSVRYRAKSGSNYFQLTSYPELNAGIFEDNYLKEDLAANASWTESFKIYNPLGFPDSLIAQLTYKIVVKGISMNVNGMAYNNVIHVKLIDISGYSLITEPPLLVNIATGDFYYALGIGLIQENFEVPENAPYGIAAHTSSRILTSYSIK